MIQITTLTSNPEWTGLDDVLLARSNSIFSFLWKEWLKYQISIIYNSKTNYSITILGWKDNKKYTLPETFSSKAKVREILISLLNQFWFKGTNNTPSPFNSELNNIPSSNNDDFDDEKDWIPLSTFSPIYLDNNRNNIQQNLFFDLDPYIKEINPKLSLRDSIKQTFFNRFRGTENMIVINLEKEWGYKEHLNYWMINKKKVKTSLYFSERLSKELKNFLITQKEWILEETKNQELVENYLRWERQSELFVQDYYNKENKEIWFLLKEEDQTNFNLLNFLVKTCFIRFYDTYNIENSYIDVSDIKKYQEEIDKLGRITHIKYKIDYVSDPTVKTYLRKKYLGFNSYLVISVYNEEWKSVRYWIIFRSENDWYYVEETVCRIKYNHLDIIIWTIEEEELWELNNRNEFTKPTEFMI